MDVSRGASETIPKPLPDTTRCPGTNPASLKALPMSRPPPFRTNPSTIARYFFHDCERFLYYSSASPAQRKREGLPEPAFAQSPLVEAVLASGRRWEEEVLTRHLAGRVVIGPGPGELHTRRLPL